MGRLLRTALVLVLIGSAALYWREHVRTFALQTYREFVPCAAPITYSITAVDPRFTIATSTLERALLSAEKIWEDAAEKDLFVHVASGGALEVSLVYDIRQETTQKLRQLGLTVEDSMESYEATRAKYVSIRAEYDAHKAAFDSAYASFSRDVAAYEAEVEKWNARGGAPESIYEELGRTKARLEGEESRLRSLQERVNRDADSVNALVTALNHLAGVLNISVAAYNTVGEAVSGEFEEALYESRPGSERITVYEFDSEARLTRVLAHELGHALGLEHIEDASAIMYRLNQSRNQSLTDGDMESLRALCRLES